MISVNVTVHLFYIGFVDVLWKCIWPLLADIKFLFVVCFTILFYDFEVLEGPNGSIFYILYWFYKCFLKIDVRVCGGLPVFEFCIFYFVFLMISNSLILYWFCRCFVKMHLAVVGGCRMLVFCLFYIVFSWLRGLGRAKRKHTLYLLLVLYMFRENLCESLWTVSSVRKLIVLWCVFDDFEFIYFI